MLYQIKFKESFYICYRFEIKIIYLLFFFSENSRNKIYKTNLTETGVCASEQGTEDVENNRKEEEMQKREEWSRFQKRSKKRRSFMETNYTSLVSFPEEDIYGNSIPNLGSRSVNHGTGRIACFDGGCPEQGPCLTVLSLTNSEGEPAQLESKPIHPSKLNGSALYNPTDTQAGSNSNKAFQRKQQLIEMEPESMECKSVTELMSTVSPTIVAVRSHMGLKRDKGNTSNLVRDNQESGTVGGLADRLLGGHLFFDTSRETCDNSASSEDKATKQIECLFQGSSVAQKCSSLPRLGHITQSCVPCFQVPSISYTTSPNIHGDMNNGTLSLDFGRRKETTTRTERTRSHSVSSTSGSDGALCPPRSLFSNREPESDESDSHCDPFMQELSSGISSVKPAPNFLTPCSSGILGRLSASTLRGKIQNLPLYLSRSQELTPNSTASDKAKTMRRLSESQLKTNEVEVAKEATEDITSNEGDSEVTEVKVVTIVSEEVTEVIEEVREVSHKNQKNKTNPKEFPAVATSPLCPGAKLSPSDSLQVSPSTVVVTTQNLNVPWGVASSREISGLQECSCSPSNTTPHQFTSSCGVFTNCRLKPTVSQPQSLPSPYLQQKPDISCSSVLAVGCEKVMESAQTPLEACQTVYTNCFSGVLDSATFDDELTVYEFSHRMNQRQTEDALLMSVPPSSLSASPASFSPSSPLPSFPHVVLPPSSSSELSLLLSPLDTTDCFLSDPHEDAITSLLTRRYSLPPTGFLSLQRDVDTLLNILVGAMKNQDGVQEHPRDTCVDHFSTNKRRLHVEARGLLAGCQRVVRVGQTPEETLQSLSESFRSLVQLTSVCLCFSSCQRCRERHAQAITGLTDVAKTYQDFARAAELLGSSTERNTCHELSIKLLARQCTSLTTTVFCLTQLFRTLTAL